MDQQTAKALDIIAGILVALNVASDTDGSDGIYRFVRGQLAELQKILDAVKEDA